MENITPIDKNLNWSDALSGGKYVKFEDGTPKTLTITNWGFYKKLNDKNEEQIGFRADVVEEDGKTFGKGEKILDSTSIRLKIQLKPILDTKDNTTNVSLQIVKVGDKKDTQFSVKEIKGGVKTPSFNQITPPRDVIAEVQEMDLQVRRLQEVKDLGGLTEEGFQMALESLRKKYEI